MVRIREDIVLSPDFICCAMFSGIYDDGDGDSTGGAWKFICRHFENIISNTDVTGYMLYITY